MTLSAAAFCANLVNPETGTRFVLTDAELAFLDHAFALTEDGRLKFPELIFSAPKKSGKTAFAAMITLYVIVCLGGPYGEAYCAANDFEQSQGRVFQAIARIVQSTPDLAVVAEVTANKIRFLDPIGATITAIASDYAGAAGANPTITIFDELWGYTSERAHRLFDEMIPPPTRKIACRLTVTYSGFEGESTLLEGLYQRAIAGDTVAPDLYVSEGLLAFWTHKFTAPWQTDDWREEMRRALRPNQFLRLIENRWTSGEESFVPVEWWDACVDPEAKPTFRDKRTRIYVGIDASLTRDSTAVVATTYDRETEKVRLVWHRVFQPSPDDPLDFEATVEATLIELYDRFSLIEARYDPYQMVASAQRLTARHLPMVAFGQNVPNITEASTNLYELIKSASLSVYADADMRLAVQRAVAVEMPRGWKISKKSGSHKIDSIVALGMAALGAVQEAARTPLFVSSTVVTASAQPDPAAFVRRSKADPVELTPEWRTMTPRERMQAKFGYEAVFGTATANAASTHNVRLAPSLQMLERSASRRSVNRWNLERNWG